MYAELKNKLIEEFEKNRFLLDGYTDSVMRQKRIEAFKNFEALDFPNRKHEEWKYDDLKFLENDFKICLSKEKEAIPIGLLDSLLFNGLKDNMLVFVNGFLSAELSSVISEEVVICSLSEAIESYPELLAQHFGSNTKDSTEPFTAMNTALAPDGAFIYIPGGKKLFEKIQLIFITDARQSNVLVQPRNLIIAGDNSEARIVQTCYTMGENIGFNNLVTEIVIGKNSLLGFYKVHNCKGNMHYIGTTEASQEKNSVYNNASIALRGKFSRNNINTVLKGENAEANFYGFYLTDNEDFVDHHTMIDHAVPNCRSNENYKGILDKQGKAVFNGKVIVRKDAQKTEAYQSNKNILLSDEAVINTKPQLEIFADDVKCSHGATSGNIDKEAMFYLRARGIEEDKARALLLNSFASDIIKHVNVHALRDFMKRQIAERLTRGDIYFCEVLQSA